MAVTLSATMSSLLQEQATENCCVAGAEAKLKAMHHIAPQEKAL